MCTHFEMRVQRQQACPGGLRLGDANARGVEQHLALQVGGIDQVEIDQSQSADAGGREVFLEPQAERYTFFRSNVVMNSSFVFVRASAV